MNKHYDVTKIDFSDLRNQKRELLKVIRERNIKEGEDELDGIVHLIDSIQDFVTDELGYPEMEVYDFADEDPDYQPEPLHELVVTEEAKAIVQDIMTKAIYTTPNKKILIKTVFLCKHCQSDNVEVRKWVNPNNYVVGSDCDDIIGFCNDCNLNAEIYCSDLKEDAKVIGFQVVGEGLCEGKIHPKMAGSFCVYNLEQANKMINNKTVGEQWTLLTIWDGDIEEPTMMFTGDPRD